MQPNATGSWAVSDGDQIEGGDRPGQGRSAAADASDKASGPVDQAMISTSFDPSTWARPAATPPEPPATDGAVKKSSRRLMIIGLGASVVTAGALAVGAIAVRRAVRPAPGAAGGAPTQAAAPVGDEHVRMALGGLDAVADSLAAQGLAPAPSKAAASAALGAMTNPGDDLMLELVLHRSPDRPPALVSLQIRRPDGSGVIVRPQGADFVATPVSSDTKTQLRVVHGQMDTDSFYSSAVTAGLNDVVIPDFFQAIVYDFDFQREIGPGDEFEAALEENVNGEGQALGSRRLLYASMTTKAKSRALYAFTPPGAAAPDWYDGAGRTNRRSLMRTPVEGAHISSGFGMRLHPVLGFTRMHKGTDFATPIGTPVFASGDGVVEFVGLHGDHGNYVRIRHSPTLETAYAHLSQYADGIVVGVSVRQGQKIALSGNSGLSSGPHVHYEVIVNGEQVDSQLFQTDEGQPLNGEALKAFLKERDRIDGLRASAL